MRAPFTDLFLRKLKAPSDGRVEYYDGRIPGFGVRVSPTGAKTFFVLTRHRRTFRRVSLGRYPSLSLEKARRSANDAINAAADGLDPKIKKEIERDLPVDCFAAIVDQFLAKHCAFNNRASTARETERTLRSVFIPKWAKRSIADIKKADVYDVIDAIMATGKPSAARHSFATIRKFFNWCAERGLIEQTPCLHMKPPAPHRSRERVLSDDELAKVMHKAEAQAWPFGPVVLLLAHTAQRRGEVVGMRWEEIDFAARTWTIPASRSKNKRPHTVPLTNSALAILNAIPRLAASPFVFPARGYTDRPYSGFSKGKRELNAMVRLPDWTLHDLRRTAATGMAMLGAAPHVIERLLNHVTGSFGGVAGVYNRFQYLPETRAALESWEVHLGAITNGRNRES